MKDTHFLLEISAPINGREPEIFIFRSGMEGCIGNPILVFA